MQLSSSIISVGFALALAPTGALAWAQDGDGYWVANNNWLENFGGYSKVHESCTQHLDVSGGIISTPVEFVMTGGDCIYWADASGKKEGGYCNEVDNTIECKRGCPDPFSTCQYAETDGTCTSGYAGCLQKMGCGGKAGDVDCIGTATGCSACD